MAGKDKQWMITVSKETKDIHKGGLDKDFEDYGNGELSPVMRLNCDYENRSIMIPNTAIELYQGFDSSTILSQFLSISHGVT